MGTSAIVLLNQQYLFSRIADDGQYETVAVEWAYAGMAAIGMDIAVPLIINLGFFEVDFAKADEFETALYLGFLQGLEDAEWRGDPRVVRLGFTASAALKTLESLMLSSHSFANREMRLMIEGLFGRPYSEVFEAWTMMVDLGFDMADEAHRLMDELGF